MVGLRNLLIQHAWASRGAREVILPILGSPRGVRVASVQKTGAVDVFQKLLEDEVQRHSSADPNPHRATILAEVCDRVRLRMAGVGGRSSVGSVVAFLAALEREFGDSPVAAAPRLAAGQWVRSREARNWDPGSSTYVTEKNQRGIPPTGDPPFSGHDSPRRDENSALPRVPGENREDAVEYRPGPSSVRFIATWPGPRTIGVPGERYGHPWSTRMEDRRITSEDDGLLQRDQDAHRDRFPSLDGEYPPSNGMPGMKPVRRAPRSQMVAPVGYDHVNRQAARVSSILNGLSPAVAEKAMSLSPRLSSSIPGDQGKDALVFSVPGSEGGYRVVAQVVEEGEDPDVLLSCSCDGWVFQGSEFWASKGGYLYGKHRGNLSAPKDRDPSGSQRVCKHVCACLFYLLSK